MVGGGDIMHKTPPQDHESKCYAGNIIVDTRIGGIERYYLGERKDINMLIPDDFTKCVAFLGVPTREHGQESISWRATTFAISVPSEVAPPERRYNYLVTAKHVVEKSEGNKPCIRVNTKRDNTSEIVPIESTPWWYHPASEPRDLYYVDVAVIPWMPPEKFELVTIPVEMFLTDEIIQKKGIGLGNEVFITGLFNKVAGQIRNIPIVRTGNIAMIPNEPVYTKCGDMEAYLIESRSIGGLSGSPVFVIQDGYDKELLEKWQFGRPLYLLGLVHGHWPTSPYNTEDSSLKDDESTEPINMGIAIVVPAKKILEVINQPELVEMRKEGDKAYKKLFAPTLDKQNHKSKLNLKFWKSKDQI